MYTRFMVREQYRLRRYGQLAMTTMLALTQEAQHSHAVIARSALCDEAISGDGGIRDCFAALAMTVVNFGKINRM